MPSILAYHRPSNIGDAMELLADTRRRALAGGTVVVPDARVQRDEGVELVDLQDLGLDQIDADADEVRIGSMVRLGDVSHHPDIPPLVAEAAMRELPSALRNQATIGGTLGTADSRSLLLAALLVHEAVVELSDGRTVDLGTYLQTKNSQLVLAVVVRAKGLGAIRTVGRTPADDPIVAAVARKDGDVVTMALVGVAPTPMLVDPDDPTAGLRPEGDFRGTSEYRLKMASVLASRAQAEITS